MSGKWCIFVLIFLLKFLRGFCRSRGRENEPGNELKFRNKRSSYINAEDDGMNNMSDDEISFALSSLSLGDLDELNNLVATGKGQDGCTFIRDTRNGRYKSQLRQIRDTVYKKAELMTKLRKSRSPEKRIHEELQQIREDIEKKFKANIVRKKRENSQNDLITDDMKDDTDPNAEYIKMLENSFPNSEINQVENRGPHIRVKRDFG